MWKGRIEASSAAKLSFAESRLAAPAATVAARSSRRVDDVADMTSFFIVDLQGMRRIRCARRGDQIGCVIVSDVNDHTIVRFERHCERLVQ